MEGRTRKSNKGKHPRFYPRGLPIKRLPNVLKKVKSERFKLLIKFPTRGRPEKFFETLDRYVKLLSGKHESVFVISCDVDDKSMNNEKVRRRLDGYSNLRYYYGRNKSKVQAINADMEDHRDFSVLLLASDDMIPQVKGYDDVIIGNMERYFPDTDGVLFFNDGFRGLTLNTLVIIGRKYYERFGCIYHPDYVSLWCDREFTDVANLLGRQVYIDQVLIKHEHPLNIGLPKDALNQRDDDFFQTDNATYLERKESLFGVTPRVVLSILIATLQCRIRSFTLLHRKLSEQIFRLGLVSTVEILYLRDNGETSIGEKRNKLMEMAFGEYVCFVDDDDDVADTYVEDIYRQIAAGSVDCVGLVGLLLGPEGTRPKPFIHSVRYRSWFERNGVYYRCPNHLNPIKRSIAIRFPFPPLSAGEDREYSDRLAASNAIKSERFIEQPLYFYRPHIRDGRRPRAGIRQGQNKIEKDKTTADWIAKGRPVPPPHEYKAATVVEYGRRFGIKNLIETGTYLGGMISAVHHAFENYITIEIDERYYKQSLEKYSMLRNVQILLGNSIELLPRILSKVNAPCLFWLDAHGPGVSPLMAELKTILEHPVKSHVLLIDDASLMGIERNWPTLDTIRDFVRSKRPDWVFEVKDDIIRFHDGKDKR